MGALTMSLARPTLLSETFTLLANTGGSNGAGGRTSAVWTAQATVKGRRYTRPTRAMTAETMQGGKASDPNAVEVVLDTTMVLDTAWRVEAADGTVYEIISMTVAPPVTFVRCRQVP